MAQNLLLKQVYKIATDTSFEGRIVFVEDYDMHMAKYLVQGVDVWLNTPRRLQEASGTRGMKAALNGVLQGENGAQTVHHPGNPCRESIGKGPPVYA